MRSFYLRFRYEIIAALCGASVMVLELVGARMSAPYFGTSLYVWTAMIGVILGALSFGYWYGGRLADRRAHDSVLAQIISYAALLILLLVFFQELVLERVAELPLDLRLQAVMGAVLLFAPAAILLGIVSPYVAKLKLSSLSTAGSSIGQLYAAGTLGSIVGTFLAGYWLIGWFGNRTLGLALVLVLLATSLLAAVRIAWHVRIAIALFALAGILFSPINGEGVRADIDSPYARYKIVDNTRSLYTERQLITDRFSIQSAQVVGDADTLALAYTGAFSKVHNQLSPSNVLVVGGGAFTFPLALERSDPGVGIDVVEIDPELANISKTYFMLPEKPRMQIIAEDGRVFLNRVKPHSYDVVYLDAFSSLTPPYQLTSTEAVKAVKRSLISDGVAVANIVARPSDTSYLPAIVSTYRSVFPHVAVYPLRPSETDLTQNIIVVMSQNKEKTDQTARVMGRSIEVKRGQVLTDDFAPVEQLIWRARG